MATNNTKMGCNWTVMKTSAKTIVKCQWDIDFFSIHETTGFEIQTMPGKYPPNLNNLRGLHNTVHKMAG